MNVAPRILIVTIKRFDIFGRKITKCIRYPAAFNLKSFTDGYIDAQTAKANKSKAGGPPATKIIGDQVYDLYGVVIHVGGSTNSGHYYAYCKNMRNKSWYECNDSHIGQLSSESAALNKEAYLLFYQKRCAETDHSKGTPGEKGASAKEQSVKEMEQLRGKDENRERCVRQLAQADDEEMVPPEQSTTAKKTEGKSATSGLQVTQTVNSGNSNTSSETNTGSVSTNASLTKANESNSLEKSSSATAQAKLRISGSLNAQAEQLMSQVAKTETRGWDSDSSSSSARSSDKSMAEEEQKKPRLPIAQSKDNKKVGSAVAAAAGESDQEEEVESEEDDESVEVESIDDS